MSSFARLQLVFTVATSAWLASGCAIVSDFGYRSGEGGAGASGDAGGQGGLPGGGAGGAGGDGAQGGEGGGAVAPWSLTLGPFAKGDWPFTHRPTSTELSGGTLVFAVSLPPGGNGSPILLGGREVAGASDEGALLGWVDKAGSGSSAWLFPPPAPGGYLTQVDLAPWLDGKVLAAVTAGEYPVARLVSIDLQTREETLWAECVSVPNGSAVGGLTVDAEASSGRVAIAIWAYGSPACALYAELASCALPALGPLDAAVLLVDEGGVCRSAKLPSSAVNNDQSYLNVKLAPDGLIATGRYDGSLFEPPIGIQTNKPSQCETCDDAATCFENCEPSASYFHTFVARWEVSGSQLVPVFAADLGQAPAFGVREAVPVGSDTLVATAHLSVPTGSEFPSLPPPQDHDILLGRLPSSGPAIWAQSLGGGAADYPYQLTQGARGLWLAGATSHGGQAPDLGPCGDPNGCAFFVSLDEATGTLGVPLVLDSANTSTDGDRGVAAWPVGEGDLLIVGSSDGAVTLDVTHGPPPVDHTQLYFARVPAP